MVCFFESLICCEHSGEFYDVWENFGEKGKMVILRLKVGCDSS